MTVSARRRRRPTWTRCIARSIAFYALVCVAPSHGQSLPSTSEATCRDGERIEHRFADGAAWSFCWATRVRTGLVIEAARYAPPGGPEVGVLASGALAQLHVAYDDSAVTYSDVTQFGLGGRWLQTLNDADCTGRSLRRDGRDVACLVERRDAAGTASVSLFSVSQVGSYVYIVTWRFDADGTFAPSLGASGALQRRGDDTTLPFGRVLADEPESLWLSHTHNYYWRLDLDLGERGDDDRIETVRYVTLDDGRRARERRTVDVEHVARRDRDESDGLLLLASDAPDALAWRLDTAGDGHAFERPAVEAWAGADVAITVQRDCERYASQNRRYEPDCGDTLLDYIDGESLAGADLVLWQRIAFHHVPRNEDRRYMHTHWDGFALRLEARQSAGLRDDAPVDGGVVSTGDGRAGGGAAGWWLVALLGWRHRQFRAGATPERSRPRPRAQPRPHPARPEVSRPHRAA